MTTEALHILLEDLQDTRELVIRAADVDDPVMAAWRGAAEDAHEAYDAWCAAPGRLTYAAYLAAEDQADAALASLRAAEVCGHAPRRLAA